MIQNHLTHIDPAEKRVGSRLDQLRRCLGKNGICFNQDKTGNIYVPRGRQHHWRVVLAYTHGGGISIQKERGAFYTRSRDDEVAPRLLVTAARLQKSRNRTLYILINNENGASSEQGGLESMANVAPILKDLRPWPYSITILAGMYAPLSCETVVCPSRGRQSTEEFRTGRDVDERYPTIQKIRGYKRPDLDLLRAFPFVDVFGPVIPTTQTTFDVPDGNKHAALEYILGRYKQVRR